MSSAFSKAGTLYSANFDSSEVQLLIPTSSLAGCKPSLKVPTMCTRDP